MFFTDQKKLLYVSMNHFNRLPEFEKELKRIEKKYPSLSSDLQKLEDVSQKYPTGIGKNFTILHHGSVIKIMKTRLACDSLRERSIRVIYAYHHNTLEFMYIEMYFKGDKESEDRERITQYLKSKV